MMSATAATTLCSTTTTACSTCCATSFGDCNSSTAKMAIFELQQKTKCLKLCGTIYNTSMKHTTQGDKTMKVGITLPIVLVRQTDKAMKGLLLVLFLIGAPFLTTYAVASPYNPPWFNITRAGPVYCNSVNDCYNKICIFLTFLSSGASSYHEHHTCGVLLVWIHRR
jgi:hypothetical protein